MANNIKFEIKEHIGVISKKNNLKKIQRVILSVELLVYTNNFQV